MTPVDTTVTPADATSATPVTNKSPTSNTAQPLSPRQMHKPRVIANELLSVLFMCVCNESYENN